MSTFETRWKQLVAANPAMADGAVKMTMTVSVFRAQLKKMYAQGEADEANETRSSMGSFDDLFGGIFGGKR